jgi:hypothetical protein
VWQNIIYSNRDVSQVDTDGDRNEFEIRYQENKINAPYMRIEVIKAIWLLGPSMFVGSSS